MIINIIGVFSIILILSMIFTNVSLSKIIMVLFIRSFALFTVRVTVEHESFLNSFLESFGFITLVATTIVIINFKKKRSVNNKK